MRMPNSKSPRLQTLRLTGIASWPPPCQPRASSATSPTTLRGNGVLNYNFDVLLHLLRNAADVRLELSPSHCSVLVGIEVVKCFPHGVETCLDDQRSNAVARLFHVLLQTGGQVLLADCPM